MALGINTNVMSLNSQRQLNKTNTSIATAMERLSSGLRINSAKDDAAGLAISERFTTQIRGLNQAVRNANDGISLSQTAEGAMAEINNNLQRIRELAVQSVNATNSDADREALDLEVQQRLAEIDRISAQTSFNGRKVLDGTFGSAVFQVGANVGETIGLDLQTSMRQADLGAVATATTSVDLNTIISGTPTAGSIQSGVIADFDFGTVVTASETALGALTEGVDTDTTNSFTLAFDDGASNTLSIVATNVDTSGSTAVGDALAADFVTKGFASDGTGTVNGYTLDLGTQSTIADAINNGELTVIRDDGTDFTTTETAVGYGTSDPAFANTSTSVNGNVDTTANKVITVDGGSNITLTSTTASALVTQLQTALDTQSAGTYSVSESGGQVTIAKVATGASSTAPVIAGTDAATFTTGATSTAGADALSVAVSGDFSIQIGDGSAVAVADGTYSTVQSLVDAVNTALGGNADATLNSDGTMSIIAQEDIAVTGNVGTTTLGLAASTTASGSLSTVNVLDVDASNDALRRIDSALTSVSDLRSTFGAIQNRFESTIANLQTTSENLSASRGRVLDADFAAETANLTRVQILQQAGIAMLSQANVQPQSVLALLQ